MINNKYTFKEFITALGSKEFDIIDENSIITTKAFFLKIYEKDFFGKDLDLETLEVYLKEYQIYMNDEVYYRKEYLGE